MTNAKNNGNNSLNSAIITKIKKEKSKFYKEVQKILTKYGFQYDAGTDDKLQALEAENKKLKQELANLRQIQIKQNYKDANYINAHKDVDVEKMKIHTFNTNVNNSKSVASTNAVNKKYDKWSRVSVSSWLRQHGYDVSDYFNFINECSTVDGIFWINPNPENLTKNWDVVLHYPEEKSFHILRIPANTFKLNDFAIKVNKQGERPQMEIRKEDYVERRRGIGLKPYLARIVKYQA